MLRLFVLSLAAMVLFAGAGIAQTNPPDTINNFKAGDWAFSFVPKSGIVLSYKGVNLIRTSTLVAHNGQYTSAYLSYPKGTHQIRTRTIPDGKEVEIRHISDTFTGTQTISFLPNKAVFQFEYGMPQNITNGKLDYCFGYLSAQPFAGRAYTMKGTDGDKKGILPLWTNRAGENYAPTYFKDGVFDSNLGKVHIQVDGDLEGLMLLEFRGSAHANARKGPVLWSGMFQKPLAPGKRYLQTITVSIDPAPAVSRPTRFPTGNAVAIQPVQQAQTSPGGDLRIIPDPKELKAADGYFALNADTKIVVTDDAREKDYSGALLLSSEVYSLYGLDLKIVRESQINSDHNIILVGETARTKLLAKIASDEKIVPPAHSEGYTLKVTPERVLVVGNDAAGTFYGIQSLRQIIYPGKEAPRAHACIVNDWPSLKFRGVLLFTGNEALPFHKKLIDQVLTKYKYNAIFLECSAIQWKSCPEMAEPFAMSQADLKKDIAYARRNYLEAIPEIATLGHCEWMFKNGQNKDLCEDLSRPYAYCPSNPRTYELIFSMFNEAIELFDHPRYFHIGHDEVSHAGKFPNCPKCSKKTATQLIVEDTNKIHDFFAKKGIQVMVWGDMLLGPGEAGNDANAPTVADSKARRSGLAKDIIIEDWHYYNASRYDLRSLPLFKKDGFQTIACTWYDPRNLSLFTQVAKDEKVMGHTLTLWVGYNSNEKNLITEKYQFTAMVMAGDYAWNSGNILHENLPYDVDEVFDQTFYRKQPVMINCDGFTVDLRGLYNVKLADNPKGSGWLGLGSEKDLANAPVGQVTLKGIKFQLADSTSVNSAIRLASCIDTEAIYPEKVDIPLNTTAGKLFFLQTTARNDNVDDRIGTYVVHYADGSQTKIPIIYGTHVRAWDDTRVCTQANYFWGGDTASGERVVLRGMEWTNPTPEKSITSIELISANTESGLALLGLTGTR